MADKRDRLRTEMERVRKTNYICTGLFKLLRKHFTSSPSYQGALGWCQGRRLLSEHVELCQDPKKRQLSLQEEMCLQRLTAEEGGLGKLLMDRCLCQASQAETGVFLQGHGHGHPNLEARILSCCHWVGTITHVPQLEREEP